MSFPASLTLIVPGLLWPAQALADLTQGLRTPGLCRLLGKGRLEFGPPMSSLGALAARLGLPEDIPAAAARRIALAKPATADRWICLDPVHLGFVERNLSLADPAKLDLSLVEAVSLAVSLAPTFAPLGDLLVDAAQAWHLRLHPTISQPTSPPLRELVGQRADLALSGLDRVWRQTLNEAQMQLHTHPVNQAREADGQLSVNSVWPWGGGGQLPSGNSAHDLLWTGDLVSQGLAMHLSIRTAPPPDRCNLPQARDPLVVIDDLAAPQQQGDAQSWRETLVRLDDAWFLPLAKQPPSRLTLIFTGSRPSATIRLGPLQRMAFWRSAAPLTNLVIT